MTKVALVRKYVLSRSAIAGTLPRIKAQIKRKPLMANLDWLINPRTQLPLSTEERSGEEIWAAGIGLGFGMYGLAGGVNCVKNNFVALPGMIVGIMEGGEKVITGEDGQPITIPPYCYDALVLGAQRQYNYRSKSWHIGDDSICAVLVVRINHAEKRLEFQHRDWIPTQRPYSSRKKGTVYKLISTEPLSVEDVITMTSGHGVFGTQTDRRDFEVVLGKHKFESQDPAAKMPNLTTAAGDVYSNAMPVLVSADTSRSSQSKFAVSSKKAEAGSNTSVVGEETSVRAPARLRKPSVPKPDADVSNPKKRTKKPADANPSSAPPEEDGFEDRDYPKEGKGRSKSLWPVLGGNGDGNESVMSFNGPSLRAIDTMSLEDVHKGLHLFLNRRSTGPVTEYLTCMNFDPEELESLLKQEMVLINEVQPAIERVLQLLSSRSFHEVRAAHSELARSCHQLWKIANEYSERPRIEKWDKGISDVLQRFSKDHVVEAAAMATVAASVDSDEENADKEDPQRATVAGEKPADSLATVAGAAGSVDANKDPTRAEGVREEETGTVDTAEDVLNALADAASAALEAQNPNKKPRA